VSDTHQNGQSADIDDDDDHPPLTTRDGDSVEDLGMFVDAIRKRLSNLEGDVEDLQEELDEEREERRRLEAENEDLREEIERLDARTDLLRLVENSDEMDAEQYAAALVQHLKEAAERQRERGRDAKASLDRDEAEAALKYPDVKRATIYKYMQDAADLVGDDDVLWYESKGYGETRLKIDLEDGEISGYGERR
jgi:TolA-binding protein